jgi:hypothetical protein
MGMEKDNELLSDSLGEVDDKSREDSWNEAQVLGSRVDVKAIPTTLVLMDKAGRVGYIVSQIVTYVVLIWWVVELAANFSIPNFVAGLPNVDRVLLKLAGTRRLISCPGVADEAVMDEDWRAEVWEAIAPRQAHAEERMDLSFLHILTKSGRTVEVVSLIVLVM